MSFFAHIVSGSDWFSASCPERRKKSRKKTEKEQKMLDNIRFWGYHTGQFRAFRGCFFNPFRHLFGRHHQSG
jgi:hypothetical protein